MRLPIATTLSSNIFTDGTDSTHSEIGNLYLAFKQLAYRSETLAVSFGCSATLPTADDINIQVRSQILGTRTLLSIRNESVHLLPFVGWYRNQARWFTQGFAQFDFDVNGNRVLYNNNFLEDRLERLGTTQDSNYFYFDIQHGYWLRQQVGSGNGRGFNGGDHFGTTLESIVASRRYAGFPDRRYLW